MDKLETPPIIESVPPQITPVSRATPRREMSASLAVIILAIFAMVIVLPMVSDFREMGWPPWLAVPAAVIVAIAVIVALGIIGCLFSAEGRRTLRDVPRSIRILILLASRSAETKDLSHAQSAVASQGRLTRGSDVVIWTDSHSSVEEEIVVQFERTRRAFAGLTGQKVETKRKLRCLVFETQAGFRQYTSALFSKDARMLGYYSHALTPRIVLGREWSAIFPSDLRRVAAHEYAHYLSHSCLPRMRERWLEEGLAEYLAKTSGPPSSNAPGALLRTLSILWSRGVLFSGTELVGLDPYQLEGMGRDWLDSSSSERQAAFYIQSAGLFDWLLRSDPQGLLKKLHRQCGRGRDPVKTFRACFDQGPDEAMARWLATIPLDRPPPPEPPSSEIADRIERELLPRIDAVSSDTEQRILAVRYFGSAGYAWRADRLIAVAEKGVNPLCLEASRALERISGLPAQSVPGGWGSWFESLPPEVSGRNTEPISKEKSRL